MDSGEVSDAIMEEGEPQVRILRDKRKSRLWTLFDRSVSRSAVVFIVQVVLIFTVVIVSLFNLVRGSGPNALWIALLSSCLGYLLPNPKLEALPH